jgi:hypothetical protein
MHHRLAESLELQLFHGTELLDQSLKNPLIDERGRSMRLRIVAKLDRAHPATQIASADRLDLNEARQRWGCEYVSHAIARCAYESSP